jgi:hypothetical protein
MDDGRRQTQRERRQMVDYLRHQQQVETRLWNAAAGAATRLSYRIEPGCEQALRDTIRRGASLLLGRGLVMDPTAIGRAYASTIALVEAMVHAARERGEFTLEAHALEDALPRLCPLFPFC